MQHPSYPPSHPFSQSGDSSHHPSWRPALPSHQRRVVCQLCDKVGHSAKVCRSRPRLPTPSHWPQANLLTTPTPSQSNWIVDSGASHHITADLQNLSLHNPYGGNEDIILVPQRLILTLIHLLSMMFYAPLILNATSFLFLNFANRTILPLNSFLIHFLLRI